MPKDITIYCVMSGDDYYVIDGITVEFTHSIHRTKKGAEAEARRMRRIDRNYAKKNGRKVTSKYRVTKHALLD